MRCKAKEKRQDSFHWERIQIHWTVNNIVYGGDAVVGHEIYIDGSHQTPDILITAMHDALLI